MIELWRVATRYWGWQVTMTEEAEPRACYLGWRMTMVQPGNVAMRYPDWCL